MHNLHDFSSAALDDKLLASFPFIACLHALSSHEVPCSYFFEQCIMLSSSFTEPSTPYTYCGRG